MTALARLRRRRTWPAWAEPGRPYPCTAQCGYVWTLNPDGSWSKSGEGIPHTVASWAEVEQMDGDCTRTLEQRYGAPQVLSLAWLLQYAMGR